MKKALLLLLATSFLACATTSRNFNKISLGMTKEQVISILGEPISISSQGKSQEFLNYRFAESSIEYHQGIRIPYYVLIENNIVKEYGREGDFTNQTFQNEEIKLLDNNSNSEVSTKQNSTEKMYNELKLLKELFDEGILTKEEYDLKKKEILNKY